LGVVEFEKFFIDLGYYPLSEVSLENNFSHSVECLCFFDNVLRFTNVFNVVVFNFFSSLTLLMSYLRIHCQIQGHEDLLLHFLLRVL